MRRQFIKAPNGAKHGRSCLSIAARGGVYSSVCACVRKKTCPTFGLKVRPYKKPAYHTTWYILPVHRKEPRIPWPPKRASRKELEHTTRSDGTWEFDASDAVRVRTPCG